tara:strand:+ start:1289 stop:3883 length:2595 start_codon:yes stop_codon:yes gene_type:complete
MKSSEIRKQFIDYFLEKDHKFVRSSSVVPIDDPTLLFTNAGMNQFKDIFLDIKKPTFSRAVNSQKCIRVSGKHNDLEEVGVDNFHHTFFEMLGNWSFGDYYKEESIKWSWELFTKVWKIDVNRLWVSVYKDDDEAYDFWSKIPNLDNDRILRFGNKDNFWEMGETGPCGPCSEIHYYIGEDIRNQDPKGVNALDEYRELWNLVFIQYNRENDGSLIDLPMKHVDTGMGLERITSILNKQYSHYETDIFKPIIDKIVDVSGRDTNYKNSVPHKVIADHLRMLSFSIADGAVPSNDGRGYVLRRVLRRAVRYGDLLGIKDNFMHLLIDDLISIMGKSYPEIVDKKNHIVETLKREEESFRKTLDKGLIKFEEMLKESNNKKVFSGDNSFRLYDTYGFPLDLTKILCDEKDIKLDESKFTILMDKQKERARKKQKFAINKKNVNWEIFEEVDEAEYVPYEQSSIKTQIYGYSKNDDFVYVLLKKTPFYFESGGQISDIGTIQNENVTLDVLDVQKIDDKICHICKIIDGKMDSYTKDFVIAGIDLERRKKIMSNHTATHLLHRALKNVLGDHVQQAGSLVSDKKLRFDYTHSQRISDSDINLIETEINEIIKKNISLNKEIKPYDVAIADGAEALFGEKYGDFVRVVSISDYSKELCGGTHVNLTGDIRVFKILSDSSLSSGVRRLEALTSDNCLNYLNDKANILTSISKLFNCDHSKVENSIDSLINENKILKSKLTQIEINNQSQMFDTILQEVDSFNEISILCKILDQDFDENKLSDDFRHHFKRNAVMIIGSTKNTKPFIFCTITDDLINRLDANILIKEAALIIDGGGGGKKYFAKAGGKNIGKLADSVRFLKNKVIEVISD